MQSPGPNLSNRRQATCIASRIQLFERLSKSSAQVSRCPKQRLLRRNATGLDAEPSSKSTTLHLKTHFQCAYGEQLKLVGNKAELGNWDVNSAPELNWEDGHSWTGQVQLKDADNSQFKLVLMGHEGVKWEPVPDRRLETAAQNSSEELAVDMAWGFEGLSIGARQNQDRSETEDRDLAAEFDRLWNPDQNAPATDAKVKNERNHKSSHGVTLEPEWGVLDMEEPDSKPELQQEGIDASSFKSSHSNPEKVDHETEGRGLVKKKKKSRTMRKLVLPKPADPVQDKVETILSNAQRFAIGAFTAVTLSATGAHGADLLMGTVGIATGAIVLPEVLEAKRRETALITRDTVEKVAVQVGETLMKAASLFGSLKNNLTQALQPPVASEAQELDDGLADAVFQDLDQIEGELADYIAGLTKEATEYALRYCPTQEELLEADSASRTDKDAAKAGVYMSNIVSVKKSEATEPVLAN